MILKDIVGDWDRFLHSVLYDKEVINNLNTLNYLYQDPTITIYPDQANVFKAFQKCPFKKLSVVILLQDPYHNGSATGIALGNNKDCKELSPSLTIVKNTIARTIYNKEYFNFDPTLESWANQGILLLNTALTVEKAKPLSHKELWDRFTMLLLIKLSNYNSGIIYCLWGNYAKFYSKFINNTSNTILSYNHPSFAVHNGVLWNCDHFIRINKQLKQFNNIHITW